MTVPDTTFPQRTFPWLVSSPTWHSPTIKECPSSAFLNGKALSPAQQRERNRPVLGTRSFLESHGFWNQIIGSLFLFGSKWILFLAVWLVEHPSFAVCSIHFINITCSPWSFLEMEYFCPDYYFTWPLPAISHFMWLILNEYTFKTNSLWLPRPQRHRYQF